MRQKINKDGETLSTIRQPQETKNANTSAHNQGTIKNMNQHPLYKSCQTKSVEGLYRLDLEKIIE